MRRTAAGLLILALVFAAPRGARAQTFYLGNATGDTALGLLPGVETQLPVRAANPSGYYYYLNQARLTFHYDPAAIEILGALQVGFGISDSATIGGTFTISGSGCLSGPDVEPWRLRVKLKPGAPNGAYIWATADTTMLWYYCYSYYGNPFASNFTVPISQVCAAASLYGDVDGNLKVESRDALIALSAAVGLPVSGFNLGLGDVDNDGLTNSRDALMMLTYAVGLPVSGTNRVAMGVPSVCPGLTPPGESMVFRRWPAGASGPDLMYLAAGSTTPQLVTSSAYVYDMVGPRLAADDATIAYYCYEADIFTSEICRIQKDGTGGDTLTPTSGEALDWSPDGTKILFFGVGGRLWTMNADGSGLFDLTLTSYATGTPSWNRDGVRIAYLATCFVASPCQNVGTVNADGSSPALLPVTGLDPNGYRDVRWSPGGDSLAMTRIPFYPYNETGVFVVGGAGGPVERRIGLLGIQPANPYGYFTNLVDWGPPGIVITYQGLGGHGLWLVDATGGIRRLTAGEDDAPSFRRTP